MHTVFELIHGLHGITLEDAGLSLCKSITRGSGVRLKQGHVINNAICNLFKYRAPRQWNSLPLNIVQCTNFTSFKRKLFVHLQENDMTFFYVLNILFYSFNHLFILFICFYTILWQGVLSSLLGVRPSYLLFGNKICYYYYYFTFRPTSSLSTASTAD